MMSWLLVIYNTETKHLVSILLEGCVILYLCCESETISIREVLPDNSVIAAAAVITCLHVSGELTPILLQYDWMLYFIKCMNVCHVWRSMGLLFYSTACVAHGIVRCEAVHVKGSHTRLTFTLIKAVTLA